MNRECTVYPFFFIFEIPVQNLELAYNFRRQTRENQICIFQIIHIVLLGKI